jgi:hypothetical protein
VARTEEVRSTYRILACKPLLYSLLWRSGRRLGGNIKMNLKEIICVGHRWMDLVLNHVHWWGLVPM